MSAPPLLDRRLRRSGLLLVSGLGVEALTLLWRHPLGFSAFLGVGCLLVAAGVLLYLWSVLTLGSSPREGERGS